MMHGHTLFVKAVHADGLFFVTHCLCYPGLTVVVAKSPLFTSFLLAFNEPAIKPVLKPEQQACY